VLARLKINFGGRTMQENQNVPGGGSPPSTPRWVKVFVIIFIALVVIVVIVHLMGFRFDHGAGKTLLRSFALFALSPMQQV